MVKGVCPRERPLRPPRWRGARDAGAPLPVGADRDQAAARAPGRRGPGGAALHPTRGQARRTEVVGRHRDPAATEPPRGPARRDLERLLDPDPEERGRAAGALLARGAPAALRRALLLRPAMIPGGVPIVGSKRIVAVRVYSNPHSGAVQVLGRAPAADEVPAPRVKALPTSLLQPAPPCPPRPPA